MVDAVSVARPCTWTGVCEASSYTELLASCGWAICPSFWREDGLAVDTVESLLHTARVATAPAAKRVVAIYTLMRHFHTRLWEDTKWNPTAYRGYEVPQKDGELSRLVNVVAYWEEKVSRIQAEGVVHCRVRVCCNAEGKVAAALNHRGQPLPLDAPVLPDAEEHVSGLLRSGLATRICQREQLGTVHGIRLIPLAADFLCVKCAEKFPVISIYELNYNDLVEWCQRLRLRYRGDSTEEVLQKLLLCEQQFVKRRALAMSFAHRVHREPATSESDLFKDFCSHLDPVHFKSTAVRSNVLPSCHGAVPADVYRDGVKLSCSPRALGAVSYTHLTLPTKRIV